MPSDTKNVKLGVCLVTFDGVDLGYTKGGCEVEVKTETKKVMVDQFGNSEINEYILGRTCTVKVPLAETTLGNLTRIMPGATLVGTGAVKASGTVTIGAVPTTLDAVTVNGLAFTFKTGPVTSPHDISLTGITTAAQAASALAAAIKNSVDPKVTVLTASASGAVVTISAADVGTYGNSYTLTKTGTSPTVSGATLAGGVDASRYKVTVTNGIGTSLLDSAKQLILHPIAAASTDRSQDFVVPLANCGGDLNFSFKLDDERIYTANFTGYPDPSTKTLFVVGDIGAA